MDDLHGDGTMRSLRVLAALAVTLVSARAPRAQVSGKCVENCGEDATSESGGESGADSGGDPELRAALDAERRKLEAIDRDNARRAREEARVRGVVGTNDAGLGAFKAGNWALAVSYFEQAVKLEPGNATFRSNLEAARAKLTEQRQEEALRAYRAATAAAQRERARRYDLDVAMRRARARELTAGPPMIYGGTPQEIAARMARKTPEVPGALAFFESALEIVRERAAEDAQEYVDEAIDVMTPHGMWLRVQQNTLTNLLPTVLDGVSRAAQELGRPGVDRGEATAGFFLHEKSTLLVFDSDTGPSKVVQAIVGIKDADEDVTKHLLEGINSLASGVAATARYPKGVPLREPGSLWDRVQWGALQKELSAYGTTALRLQDDVPKAIKAWTASQRPAP